MIIRRAIREDATSIATCLLLAMEEIVYEFIGRTSREHAQVFMRDLVSQEGNQYSFSTCWVAEENGEVVGAVAVYDGALLTTLRRPVADYVKTRFGVHDFNPAEETQAGEYYIDSLGVHPQHQGKGIGAQLLRFLIDEYVERKRSALGLLVDKANPGAKQLYLRLGFEVIGEKELAGKHMEHLQVRPVKG